MTDRRFQAIAGGIQVSDRGLQASPLAFHRVASRVQPFQMGLHRIQFPFPHVALAFPLHLVP